MRVLVTGGGGFLGGHVCAALHARGDQPIAFDRAFPNAEAPWTQRPGSILDEAALRAAMAGVSGVVHAAALADLWRRDPHEYERVNHQGARRVAQAARAAGARLIHVSSYTTLIAGPDRPERTVDETREIAPEALLGPYPRAKRRAELVVREAAAAGLDAWTVLPSSPLGPGDHRLTPPSRLVRDLARGGLPALLACLINLVDVRAVAAGVVAALDAPGKGVGERFLLTGTDHELGDLAAMVAARTGVQAPKARAPYRLAWTAAWVEAGLARLTGRAPSAPLTGVRLAGRRVRFSNAKARAALGFAPPPTEVALDAALAWMATQGLIDQPDPPAG